jgi:hypothetical protein
MSRTFMPLTTAYDRACCQPNGGGPPRPAPQPSAPGRSGDGRSPKGQRAGTQAEGRRWGPQKAPNDPIFVGCFTYYDRMQADILGTAIIGC